MFTGFILLFLGILLLLSVFFSFSSSFVLFIGLLIAGFGLYKIIKSFPKGIAALIIGIVIIIDVFWKIKIDFLEFLVILISSGLIEVGIDIIVKKK